MIIKGKQLFTPRFEEPRKCPNCIFLGPGIQFPDYDMYVCLNHFSESEFKAEVCFTRSVDNNTKQAISGIIRAYPQTQEAHSIAQSRGLI